MEKFNVKLTLEVDGSEKYILTEEFIGTDMKQVIMLEQMLLKMKSDILAAQARECK